MPFRFPQYCYTLPLSVLICYFCNGGNLEIVYIQGLFIHQRIIFYFILFTLESPGLYVQKSHPEDQSSTGEFTLLWFCLFFKKKQNKKKHLAVKCTTGTSVTCSDKLSLLCLCFRVWLFLCLKNTDHFV